jgi:hypothetical protein
VVETLHQNPVTLHPIGFEATVSACIRADMWRFRYDVKQLAGKIPESEIIIRFCPLSTEIATGKIVKGCIEVEHCDVHLNSPGYSTKDYLNFTGDGYDKQIDIAAQKLREVFTAPEVVKTLAEGVTLYSNGIIVAAGTQRPYWIPVTVGEMFDLHINYWKPESKKQGNTMVLDMILKEKESFSAEELKAPAYNGQSPVSLISSIPNKKPYMRFNPDYFDKKIPRTSVQLITIKINNDICIPNFTSKNYEGYET